MVSKACAPAMQLMFTGETDAGNISTSTGEKRATVESVDRQSDNALIAHRVCWCQHLASIDYGELKTDLNFVKLLRHHFPTSCYGDLRIDSPGTLCDLLLIQHWNYEHDTVRHQPPNSATHPFAMKSWTKVWREQKYNVSQW